MQLITWTLPRHVPNQPHSKKFMEQTVVECLTTSPAGASYSRVDPESSLELWVACYAARKHRIWGAQGQAGWAGKKGSTERYGRWRKAWGRKENRSQG